MIGIDESTAIVVMGKKVKVVGESQVVVISKPKKRKIWGKDKVSFKNARFSLYSPGDRFKLK
jgi:cyanophycinase